MKTIFTLVISILFNIQIHAADKFIRPVFSPTGKQFIFTDSRFSGLYLYHLDEGKLVQICNSPGAGYSANWSPDGSKIAFKYIQKDESGTAQAPAYYDLGNNDVRFLHRFVRHAGVPYFFSNNDAAFTIGENLHISDTSGNVKHQVHLPHYANLAPVSPDGQRAVYNDVFDQLWITDISGETHRRISTGNIGFFAPQWSPDGTKILAKTLSSMIVVFDLNKKESYMIDEGSSPGWMNDSKQVIYSRERRDAEHIIFTSEIYISKHDGSGKKKIINNNDLNNYPSITQNSRQIIYLSENDNGFNIAELETTSDDVINLIHLKIDLDKALHLKYHIPSRNSLPVEKTVTALDAPYIHQVYDTPNWFLAGHSACGATAAMMGIAYYHVLPKWPCTCSAPYSHTSDYGRYISDNYTFNGYTYNIRGYNSRGYYGYGGFGFIVQNNWANTKEYMAQYLRQHKIGSSVDWNPNLTKIDSEIANDCPFVVLTSITSSGHYQLVVGHDPGSHSIIVNDPYGNDNQGYMNYSGKKVTYDWPGYSNGHANLNTVWCFIYMRYNIADLTVAEFELPDSVSAGDTIPVTVKLGNTGSAAAENINIGIYLSTNSFFDASDPLIHSETQNIIGVDEIVSATFNVTIPDSMLSRRYGLGIRIDDGNAINELSEKNNLEYATFIIKGYPEIYQYKPDHLSTAETGTPVISAKYRDHIFPIAASSIKLLLNDNDITGFSQLSSSEIQFIPQTPLQSGQHHVALLVGNDAGYVNRVNWSFFINTTGVEKNLAANLSQKYELLQNYPNPFNAHTQISFHLKETNNILLSIFSLEGKLVRQLFHGKQSAGLHHIVWDGRDDAGGPVSSGIYCYQLITNRFKDTKRLVLIK